MSSAPHPQAAIANLQTGARVALLGLIKRAIQATDPRIADVLVHVEPGSRNL